MRIVPVRGGEQGSLLWIRSDADGGGVTSDLRAWIDDVELRPHQNIKENMDGFSHWGNFVYFNNAAAGRPDARLKIRYSIRLRPWALYATIVLFLLAAWRTARYESIRPSLLFGHTAILLCIKVALGVFVVLAVIFGLSVLGGILTGYGLYPMYGYDRLYGLWPSLRSLIHLEPYVPPALFALSMAAAASSWLLRRSNIELPQRAICNEIKATEAWVRWGLPAILGLTFTSLILGAWSGNVTQLDVPYQNVAGLVPNSDARGYFGEGLNLFQNGSYGDFGARRPFATLLRGWTAVLAGQSYITTIMLQTLLVCVAIYVALVAVLRWRGVAAATCFFAFSYIIIRPFVVTTLTECLGVSFAYLSIPLFISGFNRASRGGLLLAFALFVIGMSIRSGSMFTLPAFIIWGLFFVEGDFKARVKFAAVASGIVALAIVINQVLNGIYKVGDPAGIDTALPFLFCGLSLGSDYHICEVRYVEQLRAMGSEAELARFLYAVAWKNFLSAPEIFLSAIWRTMTKFLLDAPNTASIAD